jgi:hypothetical protein
MAANSMLRGAVAAGLTVHGINRSDAPDEYGLGGTTTELPSPDALLARSPSPRTAGAQSG